MQGLLSRLVISHSPIHHAALVGAKQNRKDAI